MVSYTTHLISLRGQRSLAASCNLGTTRTARFALRHAEAPQKQNEEQGQQILTAAQEDFGRRQEDSGLKGPASKEESECRNQRQEEECVHTVRTASEETDEVEAAQRSSCRLKEAGGSSSVSAFRVGCRGRTPSSWCSMLGQRVHPCSSLSWHGAFFCSFDVDGLMVGLPSSHGTRGASSAAEAAALTLAGCLPPTASTQLPLRRPSRRGCAALE